MIIACAKLSNELLTANFNNAGWCCPHSENWSRGKCTLILTRVLFAHNYFLRANYIPSRFSWQFLKIVVRSKV